MAYVRIRQTEFPGKDGAGYKLELLEESGTDCVTESPCELQTDTVPLIARYQMGDLPWGPRLLQVQLRLWDEDTLTQAIRSGDEEQYRLRLTKGGWNGAAAWGSQVTSGVVQWVTKVRPKKTQRTIGDKKTLSVIWADDGLEQLLGHPFLNSGAIYTGRSNVGDIIHNILNKLSLSIGFVHMLEWYPKSAAAATDDPFTDATFGLRVDQEWLYDRIREQSGGLEGFTSLRKQMRDLLDTVEPGREPEEDPPSCWDVLMHLCEVFQLTIYQAQQGWWIEQLQIRHNTLDPYLWVYNSAGAAVTEGIAASDPPTPQRSGVLTSAIGLSYVDTTSSGVPDSDYHQFGECNEWQHPNYNRAIVRYQHAAISEDLVPSNKFADWDSATGYPRGWSEQGTKLVPVKSYLDESTPAMQYNYESSGDLVSGNTWTNVKAAGNYMYCTTETVTVTSGDSMTFRFRVRYNFAEPLGPFDNYAFLAYARVRELSGNKYLCGTNDTDSSLAGLGNWGADDDNRIDLIEISKDGLMEINIKTDTTLGLPTGSYTFRIELWDGGDHVPGKLDRIHWACPEIIWDPQDAPENQEKIYQHTITSLNTVETLPDRVFYIGSGPIAGASRSRITYDGTPAELDPTSNELAIGSGAGASSEHGVFWIDELLKMRAVGSLVYSRDIKCTANAPEGEHHLQDTALNEYYLSRLERDYKNGIASVDMMEIRQDSPTATKEEFVREFVKRRRGDDQPPLDYLDPFINPNCFVPSATYALYPMIESSGYFVLLNDQQSVSSSPNGALNGSAANWTWATDDGLSKTSAGTTEFIDLPTDILGSTSPGRFTFFAFVRRDTTSQIGIVKITAGAATIYDLSIETDGTVDLDITDEASGTLTVSSTVTIGSGEWAAVAFSIIPIGAGYTAILYVLNDDDGTPVRYSSAKAASVSTDFTDFDVFVSNQLTIRLIHVFAAGMYESDFLLEAACSRQFGVQEGLDESEVDNLTDVIILRTDTGIEIWDLNGNAYDSWADATNTPGGIHCRPAYHPGHDKIFYGADEDIVSANVDGTSQVVEYSAAAGVKIRGLWYDPYNGRLYYAESDAAGDDDFGHLTGSPGAMSGTSLSTSYDMSDFVTHSGDDVLIYADLSDGDLYALRLSDFVQWDTSAEANPSGVYYVGEDQECFYEETDADVFRYTVSQSGLFASTKTQLVTGSGFTTPRASTFVINHDRQLMYLVAVDTSDKVYAGDYASTGQTSASFIALITAGDTVRGAALAALGVSPVLAAPVLTIGTETSSTVPMTWTNISGETGYVLQRAPDVAGSPGTWATIDSTIAADATSTTDTGLTASTSYWYRIRGDNAYGPGPWSNEEKATTTALPAEQFIFVGDDSGTKKLLLIAIDGTLVTSMTINAAASDNCSPAYLPSEDCYIYAAGNTVRKINSDGTGDAQVYDFVATVRTLYYSTGDSKMYYGTWTGAASGRHYGTFSNTDLATWTATDISAALQINDMAIDSASDYFGYSESNTPALRSRQINATYVHHISLAQASVDIDAANDYMFAAVGASGADIIRYNDRTDLTLTTNAVAIPVGKNVESAHLVYTASSNQLVYVISQDAKIMRISAATAKTHPDDATEVYDLGAAGFSSAGTMYGLALKRT